MQFSIGRFCIEIIVTDKRKPWELGHIARRQLAQEVSVLASFWGRGHKTDRIKALRQIARDREWNGFTLKDTKEWIEMAYSENGSGAVL